jgi:hypothetical protein
MLPNHVNFPIFLLQTEIEENPMSNLDCINILKKIRQRAVGSTVTQLIDYIDGQIDVLQTMDSTPINAIPGHDNLIPRGYTETGSTTATITPAAQPPRFRGADMD